MGMPKNEFIQSQNSVLLNQKSDTKNSPKEAERLGNDSLFSHFLSMDRT